MASQSAAALATLAVLLASGSTGVAHAGINVWTSSGPEGGDITALAIDPVMPATLYAGTSSGLFKSTDGSTTWKASDSGLTAGVVAAVAIDPLTPATLYAATNTVYEGGVFKSTDGGMTWIASSLGLGGGQVQVLAIDSLTPTTVYAGGLLGVFKSTDGGASWNRSSDGLTASVGSLAIDPVTPSTLYAGEFTSESGVWKSTDGGARWDEETGLDAPNADVRALAVDPRAPNTLYAGAGSFGVAKSTDGGGTWRTVSTGLSSTVVDALAIDPARPQTIFAGTWRRPYASEVAAGVFASSDGGSHWKAFNAALTNLDIRALAIDRRSPQTLYAGTAAGVFAIQPATFAVDSTDDAPDANPGDGLCATTDGVCTLRAAVDEANALPSGSTITVPSGTYVLSTGQLAVSNDMTIAGTAGTVIDGHQSTRVFDIKSAARVTISAVRIQGGEGDLGGGIRNAGTLTLVDSVISGNGGEFSVFNNGGTLTVTNSLVSGNFAGGIFNGGTLTLMQSQISDNGTGIFNAFGGSLTLVNSSINDNSAIDGGGITNLGGTLMLTNSTISGNTACCGGQGGGIYNQFGGGTLTNITVSGNTSLGAGATGGGIWNGGALTLTNSTVSGNAAGTGGGLLNFGTVKLTNTIVANSSSGGNCSVLLPGTTVSGGHNLDSDGTCGFSGPGDLSNTDPRLGPLQDNGGPTFTQALLRGSPAIDAGSPDCPPPATDQRGVARTPPCDIGAYESVPVSCAGDCDEHGTVTVDELLTMVHIALGDETFTACEAGDANHDTHISIDEIVAAVNNALNGCPAS